MKKQNVEQIKKGFAANLPVAASVIAYGSVLGVLAAQKSIGWEQLLFMNLAILDRTNKEAAE
jgi:predicted branched-subunit amino acid permease